MPVDIDRQRYIKLHRRATLAGFVLGGAAMMILAVGYVTWMQQPPSCFFGLAMLACPIAGPFLGMALMNRLYRCKCQTCGNTLTLHFQHAGYNAGWYKLTCPQCGDVHRQSE